MFVSETTPTPTVSKSPAFNPMYVGETVTFTCSVLVSSGWQYHWYKDGAPLPSLTGSTISLLLGQSDGGRFSCEARRNQSTVTSRSSEINLVVHGGFQPNDYLFVFFSRVNNIAAMLKKKNRSTVEKVSGKKLHTLASNGDS